jgi:hypothetical protein
MRPIITVEGIFLRGKVGRKEGRKGVSFHPGV